jgi:pyruvate carboxylase
MVLNLDISPETEAKLAVRAAAAGVDIATYASKTLERAATRPSLDEILAPLRAEFSHSGLNEDELTGLLEQAKHEQRVDRRAQGAP